MYDSKARRADAFYVARRTSIVVFVLIFGLALSTVGNFTRHLLIFLVGMGLEWIACGMAAWTAWRAYNYQLKSGANDGSRAGKQETEPDEELPWMP
jgi:hypothetical protein